MTSFKLLISRRFGSMFLAMGLGALVDNLYKNALIIITTFTLAKQVGIEPATLLSVASACFILPFFLFSGFAGEMADHFPKHLMVRALKLTEFILIILASIALMTQHVWSLLVILFLVGVQAAFFGPAKYAILPELLKKEELLLGNAMIEGGTFLSILIGTLIGGLLILQPSGPHITAVALVLMSLIGLIAAWRVPETMVSKPELKINYNVFQSTWKMVRHAFENPSLIYPILGISWFWAIGATYLTQLPVFTKEIIGANEKVVTLFNGVFTVGIALGSFYCPLFIKLLRGRARYLSAAALGGVFLFGLNVCFIGQKVVPPPPDELLGLIEYLTASNSHLRLSFDLFMLAFCGGLFIVPLYTQLQTASDEHERARTIASNNVVNALFIATASILAAVMFGLKFTVLQVLFVFALLNIPIIGALIYSARKKQA